MNARQRKLPSYDEFSVANTLLAATPASWLAAALAGWAQLLVDHANCEKKAASTALALLFAYPEDAALCVALARLAREELKHFEQVQRLMTRLKVPFERLRPSRYATGLRAAIASHEPQRKLDLLLIGALIEARSCERFAMLAHSGALPAEVSALYQQLERSEARHFTLYLELAQLCAPAGEWRARLAQLAVVEADLATQPDSELRFHSGAPLSLAVGAR